MEATLDTPLYTKTQTDSLFDWGTASANLKKIIDGWKDELDKSDKRRKFRKTDIDVDQQRRQKDIDPSDTILPVRVVDENIEKEMPSYVSYLTQAEHLAIFKDTDKPANNTDVISSDFTDVMKYIGWEKIWFRTIDGAHLHGSDAMEVLYDISKPAHVGHEHVGHDCLFYSRDIYDIQDAPLIIRKYSFSADKLRSSVKDSGFDAEAVKTILEEIKNDAESSSVDIYKVYFKYSGLVYVAWFSIKDTNKWLKAPEKLFVGVRKKVQETIVLPIGAINNGLPVMQPTPVTTTKWEPEYETMYPIFLLPYKETEEKKLVEKKGRAFYDQYRQEGQTAVLSGYVNALNRSTTFIATPKTGGSGSSPKQTQTVLQSGIYNEPMDIFQAPYPDSASILGALQYLDAYNAREINQMTESLRRKKGEKTAKEVSVAEKETALLAGVKLVLFSTFVRQVYTYSWRIVQSLALQAEIPFLLIQETPEGKYINNVEIISRKYTLIAAGDIEVVQKAQKLDRMLQFWEIISQTSMRDVYLMKMLKMLFPEDYEEYAAVFQANNVGKQLLTATSAIAQRLAQAHPEEIASLPPEEQQQMAALQQQVQQFIDTP